MHIVGTQDRTAFELEPLRAWRRARRLDELLRTAAPIRPRGVFRVAHVAMNAEDDARMLDVARRINGRRDAG
jgi:hypothetical protein